MSFYVSTATFFLLHCDEWDRVVALPRHKFVTGATLLQLGLQVLFHIIMAKFPIPENCSAYVAMILKEFYSSKINGLVMKIFSGK